MKAASLNDIKKELKNADEDTLRELCLRLGKYKKENKEFLTYLLFEAEDESAYTENVKSDIDELFAEVNKANIYFAKKNLRKILRMVNKQVRYSGIRQTELDLRIHFCTGMKNTGIRFSSSQVLLNIYNGQLKKIHAALTKLPEDLQYDYVKLIADLE